MRTLICVAKRRYKIIASASSRRGITRKHEAHGLGRGHRSGGAISIREEILEPGGGLLVEGSSSLMTRGRSETDSCGLTAV